MLGIKELPISHGVLALEEKAEIHYFNENHWTTGPIVVNLPRYQMHNLSESQYTWRHESDEFLCRIGMAENLTFKSNDTAFKLKMFEYSREDR